VSSGYWSATTDATGSPFAWFVVFNVGFVSATSKSNFLFVRAVRGGS